MYYTSKIAILEDLWGEAVEVQEDKIIVGSKVYPVIDDVIIILEPPEYPAIVRKILRYESGEKTTSDFIATDIQFTFGAE